MDSFSIHEVDRKADLTLQYEYVKQVHKDYGRPDFNGKRIHPHRRMITTIVFVGGLLGVVIGLVVSDKS